MANQYSDMFSTSLFENKIALITGADGKIGRVFAQEFSRLGGKCFLVDRNTKTLSEFCSTLVGAGHQFMEMDLAKRLPQDKIESFIRDEFGRLDVLINNAAFTGDTDLEGWQGRFEEQTIDAWEAALQVNLSSAFKFAQICVPFLRESASPSILNIGSIYGHLGPDYSLYEDLDMANPAAYGVSKAGLSQLTRWLASTLAPEIRVNTLSPGGILRGQKEKFVRRYNRKVPLGRMAKEIDVVNVMLFLSSDLASYVSGQDIIVDGGLTGML